MPYLGIFGLEFWKIIVIFEISTLKVVISESLTHTENFGIESAFSKDPGSGFSEAPGSGPDLPYKVCPSKPKSLKGCSQEVPLIASTCSTCITFSRLKRCYKDDHK